MSVLISNSFRTVLQKNQAESFISYYGTLIALICFVSYKSGNETQTVTASMNLVVLALGVILAIASTLCIGFILYATVDEYLRNTTSLKYDAKRRVLFALNDFEKSARSGDAKSELRGLHELITVLHFSAKYSLTEIAWMLNDREGKVTYIPFDDSANVGIPSVKLQF